jgi:excisionase family DNA binding protein
LIEIERSKMDIEMKVWGIIENDHKMIDELLNTKQVCELLKINRRTLFNWRIKGKLPFVKLLKKTIRFRKNDILNLIINNSIIITETNKEIERKADETLLRFLESDNISLVNFLVNLLFDKLGIQAIERRAFYGLV